MRTRASTGGASSSVAQQRVDIELLGTKDGVNAIFTTPDKFLYVPGTGAVPTFYWAGRRLAIGDDCTISESGGVGTGYDTVTVLYPVKPYPKDRLSADYYVDI